MAFENLLRSVEESAREKELELRTRAGELSTDIRARAKKEAEEIGEAAIREAEKSAAVERNKMLYLAKGEIRIKGLRDREKTFAAAMEGAARQLGRLRNDPRYPAVFLRLAREVADVTGGAPFVVHVDPRDRELCTRMFSEIGIRPGIACDLESMGGLVASSPDGLVVLKNTIESRLERAQELRKLEIYSILFGD
jgi:V/A-type H+-transporting ATPase subunit E